MITFTTKIGKLFCVLSMLIVSFSANASIIYSVDRTIGAGTVSGYVETDGTLGILATANITDWVLTLNAPNLYGGATDTIDFSTALTTVIQGTAVVATAFDISFDFDAGGDNAFVLQGGGYFNVWTVCNYSCLRGGTSGPYESIGFDALATAAQESLQTGVVVIASVSTVPVPAALWLFGSGLLGLIGVARRKALT